MTHRTPKKSDTLEFRLSHEEKSAFVTRVADEGRSASEVARKLLRLYLADAVSLTERRSVPARLARTALTGVMVLIVSVLGYGVAAWSFVLAILKPFMPTKIGLWTIPNPSDPLTFSVGRMVASPFGGRELLGWSVVPIGLVIGTAASLITWRIGMAGVQKIARSWSREASQ